MSGNIGNETKLWKQSYAGWSSDFIFKGVSLKNQNYKNEQKWFSKAKFGSLAKFSACTCPFTMKASSVWANWTAREQINNVLLKKFIS